MKPIGLTRAEEILELPAVKEMPTVKVPLCVACCGYHGSAELGKQCLEKLVRSFFEEKRKLMAEVTQLRATNAALLKELAMVSRT
jgi:hypothetical protein